MTHGAGVEQAAALLGAGVKVIHVQLPRREPELLTWQEALDRAWERVDENGWRMRVSGYRSPADSRWHYLAVRAGRRKQRK